MLLTILIVVLICAFIGGTFGQSRWGYAGWSPLGLILLVVLILWLTGGLGMGGLHR